MGELSWPQVCLSLLGTWEGAQGEQWNAETSTIIQVNTVQSSRP